MRRIRFDTFPFLKPCEENCLVGVWNALVCTGYAALGLWVSWTVIDLFLGGIG